MQGTRVQPVVQEEPICHGATSPRATTTEATRCNYWSRARPACAPQWENPMLTTTRASSYTAKKAQHSPQNKLTNKIKEIKIHIEKRAVLWNYNAQMEKDFRPYSKANVWKTGVFYEAVVSERQAKYLGTQPISGLWTLFSKLQT